MPSKRIDELTTRVVVNTDLLPPTPSGGPSGSATVAATVRAGLQQPNSASAGAGADITILAADGVTSGAGGNIILNPGKQATTGGNGAVIIKPKSGTSDDHIFRVMHLNGNCVIDTHSNGYYVGLSNNALNINTAECNLSIPLNLSVNNEIRAYSYSSWFLTNPVVRWPTNSPNVSILQGDVGVIRISNGSTGGGSIAYTSATPAALTANQNNYVLTGSAFQRINCTTASNITGIAPPTGGAHVDGRMIRIVSVGTSTVTLKHNDSDSSAANRMYMASGADVALATNAWAELVYDSTDNGSGAAGWRVY